MHILSIYQEIGGVGNSPLRKLIRNKWTHFNQSDITLISIFKGMLFVVIVSCWELKLFVLFT